MHEATESATTAQQLSTALERDHRGIDAGIEAFLGDLAANSDPVELKRALDDLRRHIYLEEEMLFPPLRDAGLVGPILVMLREHAQMWQVLDTLDRQLADGAGADTLRDSCRELFAVLQRHNPKEEQILYPQADTVVDASQQVRLREFLDAGQPPEGWVCQHLQA